MLNANNKCECLMVLLTSIYLLVREHKPAKIIVLELHFELTLKFSICSFINNRDPISNKKEMACMQLCNEKFMIETIKRL